MALEEELYLQLIGNFPDAYLYYQVVLDSENKPVDFIFLDVNPAFETMTGLKREDITGRKFTEVKPGSESGDFDWISTYNLLTPTGKTARFEHYSKKLERMYEVTAFSCSPGYFAAVFRDITENKIAEESLRKSELRFRSLVEHMQGGIVVEDDKRHIVLANKAFCDIFSIPAPPQALVGSNCSNAAEEVKHLLADPELFPRRITEILSQRSTVIGEEIYFADGRVYERDFIPVFAEEQSFIGHMWQYRDITERKRYEDQLEYLSLHDQLTGLYNRAFFEGEMKRLSGSREYPIAVISADVDGLKLINDTMGHARGDELLKACAEVLGKSLRNSDILARVGGDEFGVLLPRAGEAAGERVTRRIYANVALHNKKHPELPLSLSMGITVAANKSVSLEESYKKADDLMFREKLSHRSRFCSKFINTLMHALNERDYLAEGHAQRLSELCLAVGKKLGLSSSRLDNVALLARVHDLGKVAVPDCILFKRGSLTLEEWEIIRRHSEMGYNIAASSAELAHVADLIHKHHEWWNDQGYPRGLKGEEIPLECRIFAIADAYDVMTNHRPYRETKSKKEAVKELRRCAGTRFDPQLVELFLDIING